MKLAIEWDEPERFGLWVRPVANETDNAECSAAQKRAGRVAIALVAAVLLVLLLAGCKVGPEYRSPKVTVPKTFQNASTVPGPAVPENLPRWWKVFGDAELDALIDEAANANLDIRLAQSRVIEARAQRGIARSALLPGVNANGDYARTRVSENGVAGGLARAAGTGLTTDYIAAGFDASWEVDVFGGVRRGVESATASLQGAGEFEREVRVSVLAEVGLGYLDVRGLQRQLEVARDNLRTQEDTLALTRDRFRAGLASDLDTARSEAQVATTKAQIPILEQALQRAIYRISILLGKAPAELSARLEKVAPIPAGAPGVPVGLPSELLRRRPDIRRAERELAAATANIGVATAELFPKFYLTGAAGLQSIESSDFFDGGSRFWSLGPTLRWPIFAGGKIRQNIHVQDARQEQALIRYEQTVLNSLEEVENALVAFGKEQDRHRSLAQAEEATRRSVRLADERYRGGLTDFLDVLEAQRNLLAVQDQFVQSDRTLSQNLIRLYKALGGGWSDTPATLASAKP